jgi:FkbM family methyltransferase
MSSLLRSIASKCLKALPVGGIVGKKMKGINKKLFFEPTQHLSFFLQREIEYEANVQEGIKQYIKAGDTIFDIGGNIGQYAMLFSELAGDNGNVYSFEPDFKNFSFLQFNSNINKCGNLHCYNMGVGNCDTELEFFRDTETGGRMGSFIKDFVGLNYRGYKDIVRLRKFDTLIRELGKPSFIKIDVEGFEIDVLNGLTETLEDSKFLVEVRKETKQRVYEYFNDKGFKCLWLDNGPREINRAEEIPDFANLIFSMAAG